MKTPTPVRTGLSLVEVIVTLAVMVTLTLGLFSAQAFSTTSRRTTRELDIAREAAQAKLDEILSAQYGGLSATYGPVNAVPSTTATDPTPTTFTIPEFQALPGSLNLPAASWLAGEANMPAVTAQRHGLILLDDTTAPASPGVMMRVTVRVRWVGSDLQVHQFELTTFRANEAT